MITNIKHPILRPAVILDVNVSKQICTIQYADSVSSKVYTCPIPHPFSSSGWGILAIPTRGTRVLVDNTVGGRPVIVKTVPMNQFSLDFSNVDLLSNVNVDSAPYPVLKAGEIGLKSQSGASILFTNDGSINLGVQNIGIEYSPTGASSQEYDSLYINTESYREINGLIRRDTRTKPKASEKLQDKLIPVDADLLWSSIGRNPTLDVAKLTIQSNNRDKITRNPALVEKRSIVYEFARTYMVGTHADEVSRIDGSQPSSTGDFLFNPNERDMSRIDVFNLGLHLPNNLIEQIQGTAVDIYGNILDINRNIIDFSNINLKDDHRIEHENGLLRRSIKYHLEMNSRKEKLSEGDPNNLDGHNINDDSSNVGYSFSRWSVDVDGEGLTKINIPASSNTGNIPVLTRYINNHDSNDRNAGDYRPNIDENIPVRQDIQHIAFGHLSGNGIDLPQDYAPSNISSGGKEINYHTAYHEITKTASKILTDVGINNAVVNSLDNSITSLTTNAGGRSLHANLDGSLELNIGRDSADLKSMVLDTSGGVVARLGKDANQNSITTQTDGDVNIQVGGDSVSGEDKSASNNVRFYINANNGTEFHKIEITKDGIFITSAPDTNIVIQSQKNLVLDAKGQTFIGGEVVQMYGSFADNGSTLNGERLLIRNGMQIG